MTLGEFFNACSENPSIIVFYFTAVPLTALLAMLFGRGEGHLSPWKYLYALLVYFACVPGIFALTLSIYFFLFERRSVMETNIYTQILPLVSMLLTLYLIRKNVSLRDVPGFQRLSGLLMIITAVLSLMWILDRTHIFAITFLPFVYVILILIVAFVVIRIGMNKVFSSEVSRE